MKLRILIELYKEKIEIEAVILELDRAKPYMRSEYYWNRIQKLENRLDELKEILSSEMIKVPEEYKEIQQYLITK